MKTAVYVSDKDINLQWLTPSRVIEVATSIIETLAEFHRLLILSRGQRLITRMMCDPVSKGDQLYQLKKEISLDAKMARRIIRAYYRDHHRDTN